MTAQTRSPGDDLQRVLGDELRSARKALGWTRKNLQRHLDVEVSLQTLATYELGTRQVSVVRLVELCTAMNVHAHDLLARVHHRRAVSDTDGRLVLDLDRVAADDQPDLAVLRRWATLRRSQGDGRAIVYLDLAAIETGAELLGMTPVELIARLHRLPDSLPTPSTATRSA